MAYIQRRQSTGSGLPRLSRTASCRKSCRSHVGSFVVKLTDAASESDSADNLANADGLVEIAAGGTGFMLIKRGVFEGLLNEVPEYAVEGMALKEFYTTGIDPGRANWYLRTTISAGLRVAVDLRFMQRHGPTRPIPGCMYSTPTPAELGGVKYSTPNPSEVVRVCRPALIWTVR